MSPRAASRLESIGFAPVYDYVAGKADWLAYGLPREGTAATEPTVAEFARTDVPTCRLDERLTDVQARVRDSDWDTCIVVNDERVVLGRLGRAALAQDADARVVDVMTEGPTTIRPNKRLSVQLKQMQDRSLTSAVVTLSDGRLVGAVLRSDAERFGSSRRVRWRHVSGSTRLPNDNA